MKTLKEDGTMSTETLTLNVIPSDGWRDVEPVWRALEEGSPYTSFFLTADWTAVWLESFGSMVKSDILVFQSDGTPVGVCLLVQKDVRRGPFRVRTIYLNAGGEDDLDDTCIEYNSMLCLRGWEVAVSSAFVGHLTTLRWDEFVVPGLCQSAASDALTCALGGLAQRHSVKRSAYIDLLELRESDTEYEETLGKSTRKHVRQNLRKYSAEGEVTTVPASGVSSALTTFHQMADLHQATWTTRGKRGVFSSNRFLSFHGELLRRTVPKGRSDVLSVRVGSAIIGILYTFVYQGKVYFYQWGLQYTEDKRLSPGLVCTVCAVNHYLRQGLNEYDFLAGDAQYKRLLATKSRDLDWVVFERGGIKHALMTCAKKLAGFGKLSIKKSVCRMRCRNA